MKRLLLCLFLLAVAGCASHPKDVVKLNAQYVGPDSMMPVDVSASHMSYAFRSERGIYSFDITPIPTSVKTVTFILKDQQMLSPLSIHPSGGAWTSLYEPNVPGPDGVQVLRKGNDWHVQFSRQGLAVLRRGGRFQVIDVYRR